VGDAQKSQSRITESSIDGCFGYETDFVAALTSTSSCGRSTAFSPAFSSVTGEMGQGLIDDASSSLGLFEGLMKANSPLLELYRVDDGLSHGL
jgi:hypothetical protein